MQTTEPPWLRSVMFVVFALGLLSVAAAQPPAQFVIVLAASVASVGTNERSGALRTQQFAECHPVAVYDL